MTTEIAPGLIETTARHAWLPPDPLPVWEWGRRYVELDPTSQFKGKWNPDLTPWLKEVLECLSDNTIRDVVLSGPSQGAKTQPLMVFLCWVIANAPGPALWLEATGDDAEKFALDRLIPTVENCPPVARLLSPERFNKTQSEIRFATMPLYINGAKSPSKLHSKPLRYIFADECGSGDYPEGALSKLAKRTRTFWNAKRIKFSSPGNVGDEFDEAYKLGDQRKWFWTCRACGLEQELIFNQLCYDTNDLTKPGGKWNHTELAKTIRFQCPKCSEKYFDDPATRRLFLNGRWKATNPLAPADYVSFNWNALLPTWNRWSDLVTEFLTAQQQIKDGNIEPLRVFITETLAEAWTVKIEDADLSEVRNRRGDYLRGDRWPDATRTILTADVQADVIFWIARQYCPGKGSRLLDYGRVWRLEDLREKQKDLGVADNDVGIDSGFRTPEVYRACMAFGWKPTKGTASDHFNHVINGKTVRKAWAWSFVDPDIGTQQQGKRKVRLCIYSDKAAQDRLQLFMAGKASPWELPKDCEDEYFRHLVADQLVQKIDSRGQVQHQWVHVSQQPNHYRDCEKLNLIAALAAGLI